MKFEELQWRTRNSLDDTTECKGVRIFGDGLSQFTDIWSFYVPPIRSASDMDTRSQSCSPDDLPASRNTIVLGDFNAHHAVWDPAWTNSDPLGDYLFEWALSNGISILNDGSPTVLHRSSGHRCAPTSALPNPSLRTFIAVIRSW